MSGRWLEPRCCTVLGAAHRRRGQPCQDASLAISLAAPDGSPLQLIAVADGHGNRRHWLSGDGSRLACRAAERAVRQALAATPLTAIERWREQLRQGLPSAIVQDWLAATAADWEHRPEAAEQAFSPQTYGSTLGLVLLAPGWWGCTGLGDWDLVQLAADDATELISEESDAVLGDAPPAGEATASLCLPDAAALFAQRAQLQLLGAATSGEHHQALVLSTDGMRKSCLTDADFLQLCSALRAIADPSELEAGLAQITADGSGDDISVAIASWAGPGGRGEARTQPTSIRPGLVLRLGLALTVVLASGLIAAGRWWWQQQQSARLPATAIRPAAAGQPLTAAVAREIADQCAAPERIRANLNQRRSQFLQLIGTPSATPSSTPSVRRAEGLPANAPPAAGKPAATHATGHSAGSAVGRQTAEADPLSALIEASRHGRLAGCSRLEQELRLQWQRAAAERAGAPPPGRMPAESGIPAATPASPNRLP